jgi:hypothetical protein
MSMTDEITTREFSTKDMNQAAFLWCLPECGLRRLELGENKRTVYFIMGIKLPEERIHELTITYVNGEARVDPLQFSQNQEKLKNMLYGVLGKKERK